jgi:uncharacterized membrane protein YgcG
LYLGDNDFEFLSAEVGQLKNLQIVSNLALFTMFLQQTLPMFCMVPFFQCSIQVESRVVVAVAVVMVVVCGGSSHGGCSSGSSNISSSSSSGRGREKN